MDVYKTIITKRDTRSYSDRPVSNESLHRILQAGRMAGSAKNLQPCRFVVVRSAEKKQELSKCGDWAEHLPNENVVVVVVVPEGSRDFDAGRAAQNMMVAGWAEGIASCAVTLHRAAEARRVLGLPQGYIVSIAIPFGYPPEEGAKSLGAKRLPLEEIVHEEAW